MTSISESVAPVEVRAAPKAAVRNAALDRARVFITMLVLVHHSVIPYTYYGHTDAQSFLGFDGIVLFNDSFFMSAMFLLSGLFVWPSLKRKGAGWFLRDRLLRLGLPFAICALIVMPLAYYSIDLRLHGTRSLTEFWWQTITVGPRPGGPAWFIWVLLSLDIFAAFVFVAAPAIVETIGRLSRDGFSRPGAFFLAFLLASIVAYVPLVLYFGASRWISVSPFVVQVSRIALYGLYFMTGVGIGAIRFDQGLLANNGELVKRWPLWLAAAIASYGCIILLIYIKHGVLPDPDHQPPWWNVAYALAFATYSAAQTFNVLALFLRFWDQGSSILDPLRDNAYGIYLIHYLPALWVIYLLTGTSFGPVMQLTAVIKAIIVFVLTLALSWAATAALRRVPGATHVL